MPERRKYRCKPAILCIPFIIILLLTCLWVLGIGKRMPSEVVTVYMPSYRNVDDLEDVQNAINEITEKRYHIQFVFHMLPAISYSEEVELAMLNPATDIVVANKKPLFAFVEEQQLEDLTPYMENASEEMKRVWPQEYLEGVCVGGRLYGLPTFRNFGNYIGLNIDEKAAKELGIKDGQRLSMEEVDGILHALREKYPDRDILVPQGVDAMIWEWTWDGLGDNKYIGVLPDCGQTTKVQNLYETDDFVDFCTWMRKWKEEGLIMENVLSNTEQWQDLIYQGRGVVCFDNYGVNNVSGMVRTVIVDKWSMSNSYSMMAYGISSNCAHKETAWRGMEILYTDQDVEILLNNGIEGIHYVKNEDGTVSYPAGVTSDNTSYGMAEAGWVTPYSGYAYSLEINGADFAKKQEQFNGQTLKSKAMGFVFNPMPVVKEYEACCQVYDKYTAALLSGELELESGLAQAKAEMEEAGIDIVIQEKQCQLDAYLKEWAMEKE